MQRTKKAQSRELRRIAAYLVSGGAYFATGYLLFFAIDKGLSADFFWAKSVSTVGGWTINYLLQRYWAFNNPSLADHQTEVTARYMVITIVDFILDYFIVFGLKLAGITPYIGQFVSAGFFTSWNYLWYKHWVFPERFAPKKPSHEQFRV